MSVHLQHFTLGLTTAAEDIGDHLLTEFVRLTGECYYGSNKVDIRATSVCSC